MRTFAISASRFLCLERSFRLFDLVPAVLLPLHNFIIGREASGEVAINMAFLAFLAFEGQLFIV